jgi:hypothetical protein
MWRFGVVFANCGWFHLFDVCKVGLFCVLFFPVDGQWGQALLFVLFLPGKVREKPGRWSRGFKFLDAVGRPSYHPKATADGAITPRGLHV